MKPYLQPFKTKLFGPGENIDAYPDSTLYHLIQQRSKLDFGKSRIEEWAGAFEDLASQHKDSPYGQVNHLLEFMRQRLKSEWETYRNG